MIGHSLPNNNENATVCHSDFLQNFLRTKQPLGQNHWIASKLFCLLPTEW